MYTLQDRKYQVKYYTMIDGVNVPTTGHFTRLSEARKFYDSLDGEKSIWDMTTRKPELLDAKTIKICD